MSSGAGAGKPVLGWVSMRGVVDIDDHHVIARPAATASPAVVTAAIGAASSSMNPIRAAGSPGSIGR